MRALPCPALLAWGFVLLAVSLAGCAVTDDIGDYFSNVVTEALFVGVDDPAAAEQLGFDQVEGAAASVFLARARSLNDIESNLFDDAELVTMSGGFGSATLASQGSGMYIATSADTPLVYSVGATVTHAVTDHGKSFTVVHTLPAAPSVTHDGQHVANTALTLPLGRVFDNEVTVVVDQDGNVTWDSRPQDVGEYLDWIGNNEVTTVEIPASAFPNAGAAYAVGVAGVDKALDRDFDEFNPLVSNFAAGQMTVLPVVTAP